MEPVDLLPLIEDLLPRGGRLLVADDHVAAAVGTADATAAVGAETVVGPDLVDVVLLLGGEVAAAGEAGPAVIDAAVRRARPGGLVVVAVPSTLHHRLVRGAAAVGPALTATQLTHAMQERGLELVRVAAPGAAARLAGREWAGASDLPLDSTPGLLDAGPLVLVAGRTPRSPSERSAAFFASITRRILAASVVCLTADGRLLVVHDRFKGAWTLPGGLVDAGENPVDAAVRESHEEAGVDVVTGDLLGVFSHVMPDRIHLVYAATPVSVPDHPVPVHPHEIAEVRWVPLDDALAMFDGHMRRKVRCCLDQPGRTWSW